MKDSSLSQLALLDDYQYAVQRYCSVVQPTLSPSEKRHTQPDKADVVLHQWHDSSGQLQQERKGVHHLVHAWRATGHPQGVSDALSLILEVMLRSLPAYQALSPSQGSLIKCCYGCGDLLQGDQPGC